MKTYVVPKDVVEFSTHEIADEEYEAIVFEEGSQCKKIFGENGWDGGFDNLIKITIPESVESIEGFNGCKNLEELVFEPNSKCEHIKGFEFTAFKKLFIPKSVKTIEGEYEDEDHIGAFSSDWDNMQLTEITFEDGFDGDYIYAFGAAAVEKFHVPRVEVFHGLLGAKELKEVTFDNSGKLKTLGDFTACEELKEITIPKSVEEIYLFTGQADNLSFIEKVNFEEGSNCETIGGFVDCVNLKEITFPKSVNTVGTGGIFKPFFIFNEDSVLEKINFEDGSILESFENDFSEDNIKNLKEINFLGEWKNEKHLKEIFGDLSKFVKVAGKGGTNKIKDIKRKSSYFTGRENN